MTNCCICQFNVRNSKNIFAEKIGEPPVLISEVVLRCTRGTDYELPKDSSICRKCCEKLARYYKSIVMAKTLRDEILELIRSPYIIEEFKSSYRNDATRHIDSAETINEETLDVKHEEEDAIIDTEFQIVELDLDNEIVIQEDFQNSEQDLEVQQSDNFNSEIDISYEEEHLEIVDTDEDYDSSKNEEDGSVEKLTIDETQLKCAQCGEIFLTRRKYNAHVKREHFPGYVCDQCGKTLHSYSGFIGHLENHKPVKQFECPECGERFNRKFRLKHHMAWHSGETPYQCEICSKRFVHKVALYKHKQIHSDETKRLECHVCGFKFRTKAHLDRHMRSHTGDKPFECPVCRKCFSQMYNMKAHLREHQSPGSNRQKRFRCSKCTHTFTNERNFMEHCQRNECMILKKEHN